MSERRHKYFVAGITNYKDYIEVMKKIDGTPIDKKTIIETLKKHSIGVYLNEQLIYTGWGKDKDDLPEEIEFWPVEMFILPKTGD